MPADVLMPAPVWLQISMLRERECALRCAYHDHDAPGPPLLDVLGDRLQRAALQRLRRRLLVHHARLVLAHLAVPASLASVLVAAALLRASVAVRRLPAVGFVPAAYVGSWAAARAERAPATTCDCGKWVRASSWLQHRAMVLRRALASRQAILRNDATRLTCATASYLSLTCLSLVSYLGY
jgi:hypothetical protein